MSERVVVYHEGKHLLQAEVNYDDVIVSGAAASRNQTDKIELVTVAALVEKKNKTTLTETRTTTPKAKAAPTQSPQNNRSCRAYMKQVHIQHTVIANALNIDSDVTHKNGSDVVTLVTQLTSNRFDRLQRLAENWQGSISATVYGEEEEVEAMLDIAHEWLRKTQRQNVAIHVVLAEGVSKVCVKRH